EPAAYGRLCPLSEPWLVEQFRQRESARSIEVHRPDPRQILPIIQINSAHQQRILTTHSRGRKRIDCLQIGRPIFDLASTADQKESTSRADHPKDLRYARVERDRNASTGIDGISPRVSAI